MVYYSAWSKSTRARLSTSGCSACVTAQRAPGSRPDCPDGPGNPGDAKPLRHGIHEMRIDYGPGCRVYFLQRGQTIIVLLAGGDKRMQDADINRAIEIARDWKE